MKKYNILHIPALSFFSKELYRDVSFRWKGTCLGYLFLLLLLCWLAFVVKLQISLIGFVNTDAPKFLNNFPNVTIKNGKLSIDKQLPCLIESPETKKAFILFDTNDAIDKFNADKDIQILVTPDRLLIKQNQYQTRSYEFKNVKNFVLDEKKVEEWLGLLSWVFPVAFLVFGLIFSYIYRLIQVLIYAGIGMFFALVLNRQLSYLTMIRLACVAVTPVIILTTLTELFSLNIRFFWLICFLIAMGYLFLGVFSSSEDEPVQEVEGAEEESE